LTIGLKLLEVQQILRGRGF